MMFRYYGIPARYAEGFLVTKDDASRLQPGETLTLNGTSGHAWVEYYQDGVGWLPFEVTPGYLSAMSRRRHTAASPGLWDTPQGRRNPRILTPPSRRTRSRPCCPSG